MVSLGHVIDGNRFFQIAIYNLPKVDKVRDLKTANLGKIMSIEGTVTRTTEVKPELSIGTFRCKMCETLSDGIEQQFKFTQPLKCKSAQCPNAVEFDLVPKESVFQDWQKVRLQEHSSDIPPGSMPRSIDVILRGDMVE